MPAVRRPSLVPSRPILALALVGALAALTSFGAPPTTRAAQHAIQIADSAFSPATMTITVGDTVTWTNADGRPHTVTSNDGAFDSGNLDEGQAFTFTFGEPGTYTYHCNYHDQMQATIVVQAAAPAVTAVPSPAGGPLPNVAMPQEWPANTLILIGMLLVGGAGLLVIARRPRG